METVLGSRPSPLPRHKDGNRNTVTSDRVEKTPTLNLLCWLTCRQSQFNTSRYTGKKVEIFQTPWRLVQTSFGSPRYWLFSLSLMRSFPTFKRIYLYNSRRESFTFTIKNLSPSYHNTNFGTRNPSLWRSNRRVEVVNYRYNCNPFNKLVDFGVKGVDILPSLFLWVVYLNDIPNLLSYGS